MKVIILFFMLIFSYQNFSTEQLASQSYLNKNYKKSVILYHDLIQQSPNNMSYHYNLASAYYRTNDLINSKHYYLKALKLKPNHQDTKHNLNLINQTFIDQQFIFDHHWGHFLGFNYTSLASIILLLSFTLLLVIYTGILSSTFKKFKYFSFMSLFIWSIITTVILVIHYHQPIYGLINIEKAIIHSGPSKTQPVLFFAHYGSEYTILNEANHWVKIQLSNGLKGWVEKDHCLILN